ncbi:MAG: hypothetical protein JSR33_02710 [Proteobacteria bacterium]|nr:hypothetical protein [Pseudomonadota bacterium]
MKNLENKKTLLGIYERQRDRHSKKGNKMEERKMNELISKSKKQIKSLEEDKPATTPLKQGGGACEFFKLSKVNNNNFHEINEIGEKAVTISLEGAVDGLSNFSQGKSIIKPTAGTLSRLLGLFAKYENTATENKQEVNVSARQDRGLRR